MNITCESVFLHSDEILLATASYVPHTLRNGVNIDGNADMDVLKKIKVGTTEFPVKELAAVFTTAGWPWILDEHKFNSFYPPAYCGGLLHDNAMSEFAAFWFIKNEEGDYYKALTNPKLFADGLNRVTSRWKPWRHLLLTG